MFFQTEASLSRTCATEMLLISPLIELTLSGQRRKDSRRDPLEQQNLNLGDSSMDRVALIQTPHRFRTQRQLWAYSGLALETRISAEYRLVEGQVRRSKKLLSIRGLNKDHNHDLKGLFKGAATMASVRPGPFHDFYQAALAKGIKPTMARLTLVRKIAAITLTLWKKGENFDAEKLKSQAA